MQLAKSQFSSTHDRYSTLFVSLSLFSSFWPLSFSSGHFFSISLNFSLPRNHSSCVASLLFIPCCLLSATLLALVFAHIFLFSTLHPCASSRKNCVPISICMLITQMPTNSSISVLFFCRRSFFSIRQSCLLLIGKPEWSEVPSSIRLKLIKCMEMKMNPMQQCST